VHTPDRPSEPDVPLSFENGVGDSLSAIIDRSLGRRAVLGAAAGAGAMVIGGFSSSKAEAAHLTFTPIQGGKSDRIEVPAGYDAYSLIAWGDPLFPAVPGFNFDAQTPERQARQFGYNNDFVGFLPIAGRSDRGLLVVNHEYTNPELMFRNYNANNPTRAQVDIEINAHGLAIVEVLRGPDGRWIYLQDSVYNRRITGFTPMVMSGPAAGHPWLATREDPTGANVLGTLNNCAAGMTPWGTVLTCEENFNQYFGNFGAMAANDPRTAAHRRYGMPTGASERKWERFHPRFDMGQEPNEAFRFGWVVEIDPLDPSWTPRKRTSLGRFKHEGATVMVGRNNRVAFYTGDDERFDYTYKFVSARSYDLLDRRANFDLLDEGILYVAKFNDNGSGEWIPLVWGQGPLTAANGFSSQADVLIKTRQAADLLGATKMDRPEDFEPSPVTGKLYLLLTNNTNRGVGTNPGPDAANPRANNRNGHIIEMIEAGSDPAATSFTWSIFILCGRPEDPSTYFAGYPKDRVSPIGAPDNVVFDRDGVLWVATDGQENAIGLNDGLFALPAEGPERGYLRQFLSVPNGAELCGPEFTPDDRTLFIAIQHPGEGGTVERPISSWPDGREPRPAVAVVQHKRGARIGAGAEEPARPGGFFGQFGL
jgi:hypothetical protein